MLGKFDSKVLRGDGFTEGEYASIVLKDDTLLNEEMAQCEEERFFENLKSLHS